LQDEEAERMSEMHKWQREFTREQLVDPNHPNVTKLVSLEEIRYLLDAGVALEHAAAVRGVLVSNIWYWGIGILHEQMAARMGMRDRLQARYRRQFPLEPVIEFENIYSRMAGAQCDLHHALRALVLTTPITMVCRIQIRTRLGTFTSVRDIYHSLGYMD
jgi:hypothetical protein